ncbi:MAG: hypothetical protein ACE5GD_05890 [Candidatus Geothermarchaeales archaeon]
MVSMASKLKPIEEIMAEMMRLYNKDPLGWGISVRMGRKGYGDIFVLSPKGELWQVKIDSVYKPKPLGLGVKVGGFEESRKVISAKIPPYGFRPISKGHLEELRKNILQRRPVDKTVRGILTESPAPIGELVSPGIMQGPISFSSGERYLSERQRELDKKLEKSLDELLHRRGLGSMYV